MLRMVSFGAAEFHAICVDELFHKVTKSHDALMNAASPGR
jgi:hypothetical protein